VSDFTETLRDRLDDIRAHGRFRELRYLDSPQAATVAVNGRIVLNFASNDYLGLANHPMLKEAACVAVEKHGAGSGASRLISGSLVPHQELETAIGEFKRTEAALCFSTGYAAALGAITALAKRHDVIILDKLVHACIVDAARLSGANIRVFRHNDLADLEAKLKWADRRDEFCEALITSGTRVTRPSEKRRTLIITESVFSMDGDHAPLKEIVELKCRHGAWLMLDEAHATGVFGEHGRGLANQLGVADGIEVQMGTLGKALGASGGYICGSQTLIDYLVNRARSFIFSTAPVPAAAAAALAGVRLIQSVEGDERRQMLWDRVSQLYSILDLPQRQQTSPIFPIILGDDQTAMDASARLLDEGLLVPAIRFPSVPRGTARLRITHSAAHTSDDVAKLGHAIKPFLHRAE